MKKCSICYRNIIGSGNECIDGYICNDCVKRTGLGSAKTSHMTIEEIEKAMSDNAKFDYGSHNAFDSHPIKEICVALVCVAVIILVVFLTFSITSDGKNNDKTLNNNDAYTNNSSEDDNYFLDNDNSKVYFDEESEETTTTTAPVTTTTTTTTKPKMKFKKGEMVDVWGKATWESDTTFGVDADSGWLVDCSNVDYFDELKDLVIHKNVTFSGVVIGDYKIKFSSVKVGSKTYKLSEFKTPVPNTVYEDNNVKIEFDSIGKDEYNYDDAVIFKVTNKQNFQITIQCDSIALDGIQIDGRPTMSDEIAPKSTGKIYASYDEGSITNISPSKISGVLRIIDFGDDEHFDSYDATFVNIKTYK